MIRRSSSSRALAACIALLAVLGAAPAPAQVALVVERDAASGDLILSWTGGAPPFSVYRGPDAASVTDPLNLATVVAASPVVLADGPDPLEFFRVAGAVSIDPASEVSVSSVCLTAGSGAVSEVRVDLRDGDGAPVGGAAVTIEAGGAAVGPVVEDAGTYAALVTAPPAAGAQLVVTVTADAVTLTTQPAIALTAPFDDPAGGAGGCPADGNLRVRAVDETGSPIAGARVLVGQQEQLDAYRTAPFAAPDGDTTAVADGSGTATFADLDAGLDGPQTVTVAADGRRYVTLVDIDAADLIVPVSEIAPTLPTGELTGDLTGLAAPAGGPIELGVILPDVSIDALLSFSTSALLGDNQCYDAGGLAGQGVVPGNAYIPAQCAVVLFGCLQSLPEKSYLLPTAQGQRRLVGLGGSVPLDVLTGGGDIVTAFTLGGIGATTVDLTGPGPQVQDVAESASLTPNVDCEIDGAPLNADVLCLTGGDWDSAADPDLTIGGGRLFVMGYRVGDSAVATPLTIPDVTTVAATGEFAGIEYLGGAVAQYLDPLKPGIPPGTAAGSSTIVDRSGATVGAAGGTLTLDDFFPIRLQSRLGRQFDLEPLPGAGHQAPHLVRARILRRVTETYTACLADDSTRVADSVYWEILAPGALDGFALPIPPAGWPRAALGGDLAGLLDPTATPEDDALVWEAQTLYLGLFPGSFVYDGLRIVDVPLFATHVSRNEAPY